MEEVDWNEGAACVKCGSPQILWTIKVVTHYWVEAGDAVWYDGQRDMWARCVLCDKTLRSLSEPIERATHDLLPPDAYNPFGEPV